MHRLILFIFLISLRVSGFSKIQNNEPPLTDYNIKLWRKIVAQKIKKNKEEIESLIDAYYYLGTFYKETNADSAIFFAEKSLELLKENNPKADKIHSFLGYTYNRIGRYDKAILNDIKETQQPAILNKKLNIVFVNAGLEVYGDNRTFKMIARNVITNAVKYCPSTTNIITYCSVSGNGIEIKVFDEGQPLPFSNIESLIQNSSSDLNKKGGLGLKLVYNIIRRSGGKIYFENLEHGKQFIFWLPWKVVSHKI